MTYVKKYVIPFQKVDYLDLNCFKKPNKMNINRRNDGHYLNLSCVNFGIENTISVAYMNIKSINANLHKIENLEPT